MMAFAVTLAIADHSLKLYCNTFNYFMMLKKFFIPLLILLLWNTCTDKQEDSTRNQEDTTAIEQEIEVTEDGTAVAPSPQKEPANPVTRLQGTWKDETGFYAIFEGNIVDMNPYGKYKFTLQQDTLDFIPVGEEGVAFKALLLQLTDSTFDMQPVGNAVQKFTKEEK